MNGIVATESKIVSYAGFEHAWGYGGKIVLVARHLLNAMARSPVWLAHAGKDFPRKALSTALHLKLFSVLSVPFSLVEASSLAGKLGKSVQTNDLEGVSMNSLSLTTVVSDAVDSMTTFINALLLEIGQRPVQVFAQIALPIGFLMAGSGTIVRMVRIVKASILYHKLCSFKERDPKLLHAYLKDVEKEALLRIIPKEAVEALEKTFSLLDEQGLEGSDPQILELLEFVKTHLEKKMRLDGFGIFANAVVLAALSLFTMGTATSLPFLLLAMAFLIRLGVFFYQNQPLHISTRSVL
jgi:hypothetical protein